MPVNFKSSDAARTSITRDTVELEKTTGNIYESVVIISKRSNQINAELKEELISDARITLGTTETHIVSGQKGGESGFKSNDILEILKNTIKISADLREIIQQQLK